MKVTLRFKNPQKPKKPRAKHGSKKIQKTRITNILKRGGSVHDSDRLFLEDFFMDHPKYQEKFKHYARTMVVKQHMHLKSNCVHLVNHDGSHTPISSYPLTNQRNDVLRALRNTVRDQCKSVSWSTICELCGSGLSPTDDTHVDHVNWFAALVDDFMNKRTLNWHDVKVGRGGVGNAFEVLLDTGVREDWANYHQTHALLRRTHARCNLKRKKYNRC